MKNFLKKLHIVQEHPSETSPPVPDSPHKPLPGFPGWLNSVAGKKPLASSNSNSNSNSNSGGGSFACGLVPVEMDGEAKGSRREKELVEEEEEEYQVQLAIELSAREDPEAVQIEAVKQISLGSCSPQNSPAEVLAYRYWNYNALSFDDKILDGFYDLYGILPGSSAKMPSLIDLQGTTASSSICWEAVLVNHSGDPDLVILEQKALRMALDSKSGSISFAGRTLVQKLASLVSEYMGGPVADNNVILQAWRSFRNTLRMNAGNIVLPLGRLTVGLARHRALLFKVLADSVGIPCQLLKGKAYTGSDDGAMNIVRLHDGREWIVDLMQDPGTLISSDAVGALGEFDDGSLTLSPSLGDAENFQVISCSGSASSTISCSSGNETADKRSFGYFATSESDASNMGESHIEDNKKGKNTFEEVSKSAGNPHSQKAPLHETSPKQNQPHALARSPSWTEGIGSVAVRKMKVKDVSQYMIDATKENPKLAQKLHNVLLESGVAVPPNLFSEICSDQQENQTPETKNLYEHNNELSRGGTETTQLSKGQGSSVLPLSSSIEQNEQQKAVQSRPQVDDLRPVAGLGFQNPLDMAVSYQSQSEEHCLQQQPPPMQLMDNMPVAAAVATAAIVASSMVVAASKSGTDANVEVPVSTAATATAAAVVATTAAANMQYEKLLHHQHFPAITYFSDAELVGQKTKGKCPSGENQGSAQTSDGLSESEQGRSEAQHKTERTSDKSVDIGGIKSDGSLEDVAEFEIPWEEIVLGERIGLGSYGEVYRGDWHGTEVAVKKFLEQDLSGDALEEFKSEVRIMKRLRHPNVVLFMGAVVYVPNLSIITEFLPRGSLFRLIHRPNNQLDERRRLKMALDVARGMNYLHSCSPAIVHRDLKSPNLLVDKNWVVKVCDFGLSRIKHNTFLSSKSTAGTAEWMAPEVLRNEPSDEKCDVYSFGVILWELCTLKQPWGGMNPMQVVGAVGFQHRRLDVPGDMDPAIADIITKCWQTDPKQRPSFSEIMAALKPLLKPVSNSPTARQKTTSSSGTC